MARILANLELWTTNFSNGRNYLAIRISVIRGLRSAVLVVYELASYLWFFLKLKRLYNRAHRVTERTEIKAMSRRWGDGTKREVGVAYSFLITLEINALSIESLIKQANNLRRSTHRWCLRGYQCFVLITLRSLHFSVWHFFRDLCLGESLSLPNTEYPSFCYVVWGGDIEKMDGNR